MHGGERSVIHRVSCRHRVLWLASLCVLAVLVVPVAGCGPFGYLSKVSRDATRAVADARAAGAEQYAPYEYWGAITYLEQARLLMAYSEYERSFDYGVRARQLAEEAKRKAVLRESGKLKQSLAEPSPSPEPEGEGSKDDPP